MMFFVFRLLLAFVRIIYHRNHIIKKMIARNPSVFLLLVLIVTNAYESQLWDDAELATEDDYHSPLPITYIHPKDLPENFSWGDVDGRSYLTKNLNQHIPYADRNDTLMMSIVVPSPDFPSLN
jgi:hypothetical protein